MKGQQGHVAVRGFSQTFGLHPAVAAATLAVDLMLESGTIVTFGALEVISLLVCLPLGVITFMAQRKWYGDDNETAFIKAMIIALLTAIPSPIPAILYVPAGIVGLMRPKRT